jgi:uncharacterized protein (TIGR02594 family)
MFRNLVDFLRGLFGYPRLRIPPADGLKPEPRPTPEIPPKGSVPSVPLPDPADDSLTPWLDLARSFDGTKEIKGRKHNDDILAMFADVGHPEIKNDETAWCAAFVGACLERTGYASTKNLMARSYMQWGRPLKKPIKGCVAVFGVPGSAHGHVGFYVGEDAKGIYVLGGNQSNAVNVKRYPRKSASLELIGYRWPTTLKNSRTVAASVVGGTAATIAVTGQALSEGLTQLGAAALPFGSELKSLAGYAGVLGIVGGIVCLVAYGVIIYARVQDLKLKGR